MTDSAAVEDAREIEKTAGVVPRWNAEIKAYQKTAKDWQKDVKTNYERYSLRDKQGDPAVEPDQRFNILWSNTQTAAPAVFSQVPVPAIERRHRDKDLVGRVASQILERAVSTDMEFDDLDVTGRDIRLDFLLAARSVTWVRYDPTIVESETAVFPVDDGGGFVDGDGNAFEDAEQDEDGFMVRSEQVTRERAPVDYVHWSDFAHKPCKSWKEVQRDGWVGRRSFLTRRQVIDRFGEEFRDIPLTATPRGMEQEDKSDPDKAPIEKLAEVWEIWDVRDRKAIWIAPKFTDKPLDSRDDPLGLEEFFPCPRPAYGTLTTDSLIPIPDYQQYQALAEELDDLTERISVLQEAIKVVGVYDSSLEGLGTLLTKGNRDNRMVPVSNMAAYLGKGAQGAKMQNVIQFFPLEVVVQALISLYEARDRTKQTLFEISGLADIIRGQVDPREKLGQSRIKGQFATLRLDDKQDEISRMLRDMVRIKAEIIAEQFGDEILRELSGFDQIPGVVRLKRETMEDFAERAQAPRSPTPQREPPAPPDPQMIEMQARQQADQRADELFQQAVELIRDDKTRGFRIEIETNSTVAIDEQDAKESRIEFLTAATSFLQQSAQAPPQMWPLLGDMLLFAVRGFKAGRAIESSFEDFVEDLRQPEQPQNEQPNPDMLKIQADQQQADKKLALERQQGQEKLAFEREKHADEMALKRQEAQSDVLIARMKTENDASMSAVKVQMEGQLKREVEAIKARLAENKEARTALLEVAQTLVTVANAQQSQANTDQANGQVSVINEALGELRTAITALSAPRQIIRDESGRAVGVGPQTTQ